MYLLFGRALEHVNPDDIFLATIVEPIIIFDAVTDAHIEIIAMACLESEIEFACIDPGAFTMQVAKYKYCGVKLKMSQYLHKKRIACHWKHARYDKTVKDFLAAVASEINFVFLCGGDIAKSFIAAVGAKGLDLIDEPVPLAVHAKLIGGIYDALPICTKGGMIGNAQTLDILFSKIMKGIGD
ncbi:MAG: hypothetical protein LBN22_10005 [Clostridiales Family XIII bacterium]|jgi:uncharacterized protein YgbK (DUF1537 family)|nr:hypothetical protein [Clostridiales Family XIII bacterium]